ncbi:MAG TPA: universal stress protein [Nitrolancea sp.]|jgi:nucleotide-binding universal stress UspA family protein|nr:universal stress protein [Nitrolancea sp.]
MEPFSRVLIPLDGSHLAETVLPAAFVIAQRCGATVTLLHVLEHNAPERVHGEQHLSNTQAAGAYLNDVAQRYQVEGVQTERHVHENPEHDVARSIAAHAAELQVDLIALTTHGSGGLRGFLFGSIAQQTLRHTTRPVLLVRPEVRDGKRANYRTILVPLDGTPQASTALPLAEMLAIVGNARLHLIRVVPTVGTIPSTSGSSAAATFSPSAAAALLNIEEQEAANALAAQRDALSDTLTVTLEVRRGEVVDELQAAVERADADLVVMSTHGRAGLEGLWTGSVASKLIGRLTRPVILVPIPRGPATD